MRIRRDRLFWGLLLLLLGTIPLDPPRVEPSPASLDVASSEGIGSSIDALTVDLPGNRVRDLSIAANAGNGTLTLGGASLTSLDGDLNADDLRIDATGAMIDRLDLELNAGRLDVEDDITFNHNLRARGLAQNGQTWSRAGAAGTPVIDLTVAGSAANFNLDPDGGC